MNNSIIDNFKFFALVLGLLLPGYTKIIIVEDTLNTISLKKSSKVISLIQKALSRRQLEIEIKSSDSLDIAIASSQAPSTYFCSVKVKDKSPLYQLLFFSHWDKISFW